MEVIRRRLLPKHSRTSVSRRSCWTRAQRASYLFRPFTAQTSGCTALRFYTMDQDGLRPSRTGETPMVQAPYAVKRANPRFSFFADAEVTLRDGTRAVAQLAELSSRGCYIDTLEPIPVHTKLRLKICDGTNSCELPGKVIYMHSGGGLGIFGMGVLFGDLGAEQHSAIDAWLHRLAGQTGKNSGKHSFTQIRG
ncbi:MAG: hypothetical protein DMG52_10635 [Acidobacteria bacterium]|nr:MAG: hypothetical protein DMG52_10635 [Acidobacteriota bacterium]